MKIVVTGAGGLLGREVWRLFEARDELFALGRTQPPQVEPSHWRECDLTHAKAVYETVTRANPDLVIHCAAYNNVDGAEADPDAAYRANALAVRHLALACQRFDAALMTVSTDYVFDGENAPGEGYREFDTTRPLSRYGESKRWGELFAEQLLNKFYVVRTSWLFGPTRPTWIDTVAAAPRERKPIVAVQDMVSAPTYTPDLAQAMFDLAQSGLFGYYHLTNTGFCNRIDLAREVLRMTGQSGYGGIEPRTQRELRLPARRPAFSGLQNHLWRLNGCRALRPWQEALAEHLSRAQVPL